MTTLPSGSRQYLYYIISLLKCAIFPMNSRDYWCWQYFEHSALSPRCRHCLSFAFPEKHWFPCPWWRVLSLEVSSGWWFSTLGSWTSSIPISGELVKGVKSKAVLWNCGVKIRTWSEICVSTSFAVGFSGYSWLTITPLNILLAILFHLVFSQEYSILTSFHVFEI